MSIASRISSSNDLEVGGLQDSIDQQNLKQFDDESIELCTIKLVNVVSSYIQFSIIDFPH